MNKFVSLALCSAVCTSTWAKTEISVVFTHENKQFSHLFDDFPLQNPDLSLTVKWIDQSELKIELIKQMEQSETPDVVMVPSDHVGLYRQHLYSEVPDVAYSADILQNQTLMETVIVDGKKLAIPIIQGNNLLLYYNKALVKQAAANWQELALQDQALKKQGLRAINWSFSEMYWFVPFLGAYGGWPLEHSRFSLDTPAMQQALTFYWDLNKQGIVEAECNYDCAFNGFIQQKTAYTINGIWSYGAFKKELGDQLGISLLPKIADKDMQPMFSSIVMTFPNHALEGEKKEALLRLAHYVQSPSVQLKIWQDYHEFAVDSTVFKSIQQNADLDTQAILAQLAKSRAMPSDTQMAYAWESMKKGFVRYGSGAINAQEAASMMQKIAEKSVKHE